MIKNIFLFLFCIFSGFLLHAQERQAFVFTYQGRAFDTDGTTPLTGNATFTIQIRSSDGTCLVYEETHVGVNLTTSNGFFALNVGSGTPTAGSLSFPNIFNNLNVAKTTMSGTCGGTYTPVNAEARVLRVTVNVGGPNIQLDDQFIYATPQALVADTLSGYDYQSFVMSLTTVERDALTAVYTNQVIFNETTNQFEKYNGATWGTFVGNLMSSNNLSDLANAATARTNLGLAIGTNVQAYDADTAEIAALSCAANQIIKRNAGNTAWECAADGGASGGLLSANNLSDVANAATSRTNLGLAIGTNVQAYDADLTEIAALNCAGSEVVRRNAGDTAWECAAQTTDTNTTYSAGSGIALAGTTFSVAAGTGLTQDASGLSANTTYLQRRVSSSCAAGQSIRVINSDGSVTCEVDTGLFDGSGTANRIAKFSDADTLADSNISDDGTDINILTGRYLDVADSGIKFNDALYIHQTGSTVAGEENTYIGKSSGLSTAADGVNNVAVGYQALSSNTSGDDNVAIGANTLANNTTADKNVAIGKNVMNALNTANGGNIGIGFDVLKVMTAGGGNVAIGKRSMISNIDGFRNVAVGSNTLYFNTSGTENVAVGDNALYSNTTANNSIGIGQEAGYLNQTGQRMTAVGAFALRNNTANGNTALGYYAANANTTGTLNTAIGDQALLNNTDGFWNTAVGQTSTALNTSGTHLTAMGRAALYNNTTGVGNTAMGEQAMYSNTTGSNNVAIGRSAMGDTVSTSTGDNNIAIGYAPLYKNTTGYNNIAIGFESGNKNTTGHSNNSLGYGSLQANTTGYRNIAIGRGAMYSNSIGNDNVAVGHRSLYSVTGTGNVGLGYEAGYNEAGSNKLYIANSSTSSPLIGGDFSTNKVGIGRDISSLSYNFEVQGTAGKTDGTTTWAVISDRRLKNHIRDYDYGLDKINQLRTVRYFYNENNPRGMDSEHEQIGFIAQEVKEVIPEAVRLDEDGYYSLRVDPILWASVNAIQELDNNCKMSKEQMLTIDQRVSSIERNIASLQDDNERLKKDNKELRYMLKRLMKRVEKLEK